MAANRLSRLLAVIVVAGLAAGLVPPVAHAQLSETAEWAIGVGRTVRSVPNVTYLTANGWEGKLDIYVPRSEGPHPAFIYFHGGAQLCGHPGVPRAARLRPGCAEQHRRALSARRARKLLAAGQLEFRLLADVVP